MKHPEYKREHCIKCVAMLMGCFPSERFSQEKAKDTVQIYSAKLQDFDSAAVSAACDRLMRSSERFPSLGVLVREVEEVQREAAAAAQWRALPRTQEAKRSADDVESEILRELKSWTERHDAEALAIVQWPTTPGRFRTGTYWGYAKQRIEEAVRCGRPVVVPEPEILSPAPQSLSSLTAARLGGIGGLAKDLVSRVKG